MTPILFPENETRFTGMGLGGMPEAQKCRVMWQLNGEYELELKYPVLGRRFRDLKPRRIIWCSVGPEESPQPFRIYRRRMGLLLNCTVYARHLCYDLMGYTVSPFAAGSLAEALERLQDGETAVPHPFTLATDKTSTAACTVAAPRSIWSMLGGQEGSLLDRYKGQWEFNGFTATLRNRLGADRGVMVRYGKNLLELDRDDDQSNVWTAVEPYWLSADAATVVTLPEKRISTGTFEYTRIQVLDLSTEWIDPPTVEQLRERTERYIQDNAPGVPDLVLGVSFVPLDQTEEYKGRAFLKSIRKGDTVTVEFPTAVDSKTGVPTDFVRTSAQNVECVWLPMEDKYESIRLGKPKANFIKVLAQTQKELQWVLRKGVR